MSDLSYPGGVVFRTKHLPLALLVVFLFSYSFSHAQDFCPSGTTMSADGNGDAMHNSLVDLDGDTDLDLVIYEVFNGIRYYTNDGSGNFTLATNPGISNPTSKMAFGDIDDDGDNDYIFTFAFFGSGSFQFVENDGDASNPSFISATTSTFAGLTSTPGGVFLQPEIVDLDGDGDLDVLCGDPSGNFYFYVNEPVSDGMGGFDPSFTISSANPFNLTATEAGLYPVAVDFDDDGDFDILSQSSSGTIYYHENVGTAMAPDFTGGHTSSPFGLPDGADYESLDGGDMDGDGDQDILYNDAVFVKNTEGNNAPDLSTGTSDQVVQVGFISTTIDVSSLFSDSDGDEITITAGSSDESIVTANVSMNTLTITEIGNGTATVTVTAEDINCATTDDVFSFKVNTSPTVVNEVSDQLVQVGFTSTTIDIADVFDDVDGDGLDLSASSGELGVVTASVTGTTLTVTEVGGGTASITITADDGDGGTETEVFAFRVNNSPAVSNAVSDQLVQVGFTSAIIDISEVFDDIDGDGLDLSASSGDAGVVTASVTGTTLTVTETGSGTTSITITADDGNSGSATEVFSFRVNVPPVVSNPVDDQSEEEGFTSTTINMSGIFSDADGDVLSIEASSDNTAVVTASVSETTLTITEVGIGTASISLTANDGNGGLVTGTFAFTVEKPLGFGQEGFAVQLHPNPATTEIRFSVADFTNQQLDIRIVDMSGKLVTQTEWQKLSNSNLVIDISKLNKGVYILEINSEDRILQRRFLKE